MITNQPLYQLSYIGILALASKGYYNISKRKSQIRNFDEKRLQIPAEV